MATPEHLREAASRAEDAMRRIEMARESAFTPETSRVWLLALTDYVSALTDLHRFTNESIHEKLHELARHLRVDLESTPRAH